jgi:hypothetical protein
MRAVLLDNRHRAIAESCYITRQLHAHFDVMVVVQQSMRQIGVIAGLLTMGVGDLRDWKFRCLESGRMRRNCQQQHRQGDHRARKAPY